MGKKMKRTKHSPLQIVPKLKQADIQLGGGQGVVQVVQAMGVSEQTYYGRRRQYSGAGRQAIKHLKELEQKNTLLKRIIVDQALDLAMVKDVISKA